MKRKMILKIIRKQNQDIKENYLIISYIIKISIATNRRIQISLKINLIKEQTKEIITKIEITIIIIILIKENILISTIKKITIIKTEINNNIKIINSRF